MEIISIEEFRDAICLRYNWPIKQMQRYCECGASNNVDHALTCKLGGFVIMRHNAIRDLEAEFLDLDLQRCVSRTAIDTGWKLCTVSGWSKPR